jgi:ATP-dependent helicase/nuclease subunit B
VVRPLVRELAEVPAHRVAVSGLAGLGAVELVAPLGSAIGLDADVVLVVGLAEELVPGRLREDALPPERVRALAPG